MPHVFDLPLQPPILQSFRLFATRVIFRENDHLFLFLSHNEQDDASHNSKAVTPYTINYHLKPLPSKPTQQAFAWGEIREKKWHNWALLSVARCSRLLMRFYVLDENLACLSRHDVLYHWTNNKIIHLSALQSLLRQSHAQVTCQHIRQSHATPDPTRNMVAWER